MVQRAEKLQEAVRSAKFKEFCEEKLKTATTDIERQTWGFIKVFFESQSRNHILQHLNFDPEAVNQRITEFVKSLPIPKGLEDDYKAEDEDSETEEEPAAKASTLFVCKLTQPNMRLQQPNGVSNAKPNDVSGLFGESEAEFDIAPQRYFYFTH